MPLPPTDRTPPQAFVRALEDAGIPAATSAKIDLAKTLTKHLRPLGHEIALWREAIVLLHSRLVKNRLSAPIACFIRQWLPAVEPPAPLPATFCLLLGQCETGAIHLHAASVPFAADPGWWALLQLPALKDHWAAALRASHFEHLLTLLPGAWMVDDTPMVPGTVIHGLNIPSWDHLDSLHGTGRFFARQKDQQLLVEEFETTEWWLAHYANDGNEVNLTQAHQAIRSGDGWAIQQAALA